MKKYDRFVNLMSVRRNTAFLITAMVATLASGLRLAPALATSAAKPTASYDAELSGFSYPFPVKFFEVKVQRQVLKIAYMDVAAAKPNGKTVLLLHGKNFGAYYWEPTIRLLNEKGFRVIAPDQIGFGKSSKPEHFQFTFQGLAASTEALLSSLKVQSVAVVGHSMGGMLATRFALMYPLLTSKLVLVNPLGLEDWKTKVPYHGLDEIYAQELKTTPDSIREYQKKAYYAGEWKPEYEQMIQAQAGWTRHADFSKVAWNSALTFEMIYTQPVLYEFPLVKVPTLLIIGKRDRTAPGKQWASKEVAATLGDYPKLGPVAAKLIPNAQLVEIEGAGHVPQTEKPDEYAKALIGFLK